MASLAKIGAQIGVEGYSTFAKTISNIKRDMKEFKAEVKAVTSSFNDETRTIKQNSEWKEKQNKLIDATKNKLQEEKAAIEAITSARSKLGEKYIQKQQEILNSAVTTKEQTEQLAEAEREYASAMAQSYSEEQKYNTQASTTIANLNALNKELENAPTNLMIMADAWKNATSKNGEIIKEIGSGFTKAFTVPYVAGVTASVKAAADWETAFTGVKKTNDEVKDSLGRVIYSYDDLEKALKGVGLETASSYTEIAKVAETLGQLGFKTEVVGDATKSIIQLADSTNLAAEEGASYVATILNLMNRGLPVTAEQVNNLGSALVYLGNNYNTTETDIAHMAARLAPAAAQLELSAADVLALSTALSTAQITAEGGGTAMTQVLTNITKNVANFRNNTESTLPRIAQIAGMSAEDFADAWESKPITAIDAFITGLSKLDENGEYTAIVFDELGMSGIRQALSLNALSITHKQLSKAISDSNREYELGEALSDEASKKYKTVNSQVQQLKNSLALLGDSMGSVLLEPLRKIVDGLTNFFVKLSEMDDGTKKFLLTIGGVLATVGPILVAVGKGLIIAAKLKSAIAALGGLATILAPLKAILLALFTPGGIIIAGIAAMVGIIIANWDTVKEVAGAVGIACQEAWQLVVEIFTNIVNGIKERIELAAAIVTGVVQLIRDFFVNKFNEAKNNVINTFTALKDGISNRISTIRENIINGLAQAFLWIVNKVQEARSWGRDLVENIASGIRSAISSVTNAVKNVAHTIWSYLHFTEPEKGLLSNFHNWMPDFMYGLATDINKYSYLVEDAIGNVARSMSLAPNNNSVNYGGVVINLNVPEGANGQQLVNEIETELANRSIRRRAVFG